MAKKFPKFLFSAIAANGFKSIASINFCSDPLRLSFSIFRRFPIAGALFASLHFSSYHNGNLCPLRSLPFFTIGTFFRISAIFRLKWPFLPLAHQVLSIFREREFIPGRICSERQCALAGSHLPEHGFQLDPRL
jgi:hypothetical protein